MELQALTYLVVGASFALYIGIAIWARARNTGDFYIAGQGVSPVANGMATAADWMSAASFISMAGLIAFLGYDGSVYLMGWTGGYVLLALLLAPYLRKFGKFTVPEFIAERYYSKTARIVAVICLIFISFTYVAGQMRGVGIVFSRFLEVDVTVGLIIGMAVVFIYAVLGGMKGITYTQVAQYCVLIFAYTVPAVFIAIQITGNPIPQLAFGADVAESGVSLLDKLDDIVTSLGFNQYTSGTKSRIDVFCITLALMAGTAGLPHVIVRFFTVPKVRDARTSAGFALLFIAPCLFARLEKMPSNITGNNDAAARPKAKATTCATQPGGSNPRYPATMIANAAAIRPASNSLFSEMLGKNIPLIRSWDTAAEMTSSNPAAVDSAAAIPPAATSAMTQDGSPAISGFASTMMSGSTPSSLPFQPYDSAIESKFLLASL